MKNIFPSAFACLLLLISACESSDPGAKSNPDLVSVGSSDSGTQSNPAIESASVTAVTVNGDPNLYTFSVTIESPDIGCNQYANWWEVVKVDGSLVYRRILAHSHVNEQPFTRNGGPIAITATEEVIVRAHMNNTGYGKQEFKGSVEQGFKREIATPSFARELASVNPLPQSCAF